MGLSPTRASALHDILSAPWNSIPKEMRDITLYPSRESHSASHLNTIFNHISNVRQLSLRGLVLSGYPANVLQRIVKFTKDAGIVTLAMAGVVFCDALELCDLLHASPSLRTLSMAVLHLEVGTPSFAQAMESKSPHKLAVSQLENVSVQGSVAYKVLESIAQGSQPTSLTIAEFQSHWSDYNALPVVQWLVSNSERLIELSLCIDGSWFCKQLIQLMDLH